ncbi:S41 family peptidase [Mucilaginibacter sp. BT774]|uniref:S41 family peptidase n=1 Tax=Mucilaginibacter sp. BT774 TaxID=3062276 RepID=UPI002674C0D4|nr:S41 family peptidase [Mucilaginibacter sp. BT774]MDO3626699.1 S41 family peptidase [Mucilaginibacter sp. BT774]
MKRAAQIIFKSAILLLLGIAIGLYLAENTRRGFPFPGSSKVSKVLQLVHRNYVDSVNVDSIEGVTVNNLLQNLDPHSLYLPPQQAESINEKLDGGFNGIGIEYQILRDTLVITQVYGDGPAQKAGMEDGDKVIEVNNKKFSGTNLTPSAVNKVFKGDKDSQIALSVLKPADKSVKVYHLKRGHVDLSSLDASYMAAPSIGYIKISKFAATTDPDFRDALKKLKEKGMQKLVLDLRGNGGGYLSAATELASEFLEKGKLIVYTKGVHEPRAEYLATDSGLFRSGKLAVLIDEYSASASEILAGALQDFDRAVIVGRRSFGKGLVQQQFTFNDGSAVNLTVARYYTPSGRSIQKSYKDGTESYRNEVNERVQKGELFSEENYLKDSAFKKAAVYHTSSGRKVFSGGGIMPDVFVPADTTGNTMLIQELGNQQLFNAFVIDKMQGILNSFKTDDNFVNDFKVSDNQFDDFIIYASKTLKEMDSKEIKISKDNIKLLLKAFAARFKWGDTAYYKVLNSDDETLKKAILAID